VDVAIENTGNVRLIETAYELTAPQGRTILVGVPQYDEDITIHSLPLHFGKVLTGCEGGQSNPPTDIPRYLRLYQHGKLTLDRLITHRFPLVKINEALDVVRSGEAGRVILTMG
jgi:S-(hydroxymethyl)glutathione dehydrogenase/alcohol dehydrogenase